MCLSFTPPLSASAAATATAAAGSAAATGLARRRSLLGQVRGGQVGWWEPRGGKSRSLLPARRSHRAGTWRKHVPPGAVAVLLVEKPPRRAIIPARRTVHRCPTRKSPDLATFGGPRSPGDRGRAASWPRGGSGGCTWSRAWRSPGRPAPAR